MSNPKTWTDDDIVELMLREAIEFRDASGKLFSYRDMMECIFAMLKDNGLIEFTP